MKKHLLILTVLILVLPNIALSQETSTSSYEAIMATRKPTSGYDDGFFIRNEDDSFELKINMQLRLQYLLEHATAPIPEDESPSGRTWLNTFRVRGAKITFSGKAFDKLKYSMFVQRSTGVSTPEDVYYGADFSYAVVPQFVLEMGQISVPGNFGGRLTFIEDPITGTLKDGHIGFSTTRPTFNLGDDIGFVFKGDIGMLSYAAYFGNGSGDNVYNANLAMSFSGRLNLNILGGGASGDADYDYSETPKVTIGAGGRFNDAVIQVRQDEKQYPGFKASYNRTYNASASAALQWKGFGFTAEAYYMWLHVDKNPGMCTGYAECSEAHLTDFGYNATASYFVIPQKLVLGARAAQIFREGPDNNAWQVGGALSWYILKKNFILQLNYDRIVDFDNVPGTPNDIQHYFRGQFTVNI